VAAATLTPALIVGAVRYGETSRIVRLSTRDYGVVSAIAKGALRPRSRFGASLQLLSEGLAHLIPSRSSDLHALIAFDLTATHAALGGDLQRFHAAVALAEVAGRFVPSMANPELHEQLVGDIALLELVPVDAIAVIGLRALWRLIAQLGLAPAVQRCARDGDVLPVGEVALSLRDGGFLCARCAQSGATTRLAAPDRNDLVALLEDDAALPVLTPRQVAAHRRLLVRWLREHMGEPTLPALETWQRDDGT
jgi:DNA repair protein RecO (recombination protein O)